MKDIWQETVQPLLDRITDDRLRILLGFHCLEWSWLKLRSRHLQEASEGAAVVEGALAKVKDHLNRGTMVEAELLDELHEVDPDLEDSRADVPFSIIVYGVRYLVGAILDRVSAEEAALEATTSAFDALQRAEKSYPQSKEEVARWSKQRLIIPHSGMENEEIASSPLLREALASQKEFAEQILDGRLISA